MLRDLESGRVAVVARDLAMPSPLALEILTARPYAYLDDAPLEERRTQAVIGRRWLDEVSAERLGRLDVDAIDRVRIEAWPTATTPDELHDALLSLGFVTAQEVQREAGWAALLGPLLAQRRVTCLALPPSSADAATGDEAPQLWVCAERLPLLKRVVGNLPLTHDILVPDEFARREWTREAALVEVVRSRLGGLGPVTTQPFIDALQVTRGDIDTALAALATEGVAMSGFYTPDAATIEWCDRGLLARIHRYTITRLRQEIEPVSTRDFMRFLFRWQHVAPSESRQGPDALDAVIAQLQGFEAPAAAWESEVLPVRLADYDFTWLDDLCLSGRAVWTRLTLPGGSAKGNAGPIRTTPVALLPRRAAPLWNRLVAGTVDRADVSSGLSLRSKTVFDFLQTHGAAFYDEIVDGTRLLRTQVEEALAELVASGLASSDSFAGLRALLTPSEKRKPFGGSRRHRRALSGIEDAGRWSLHRRLVAATVATAGHDDAATLEHVVHALLRRYGVVFWRLLEREGAWLPPWRDLLRVLRRLEARGEIRGGRFVAGISGEQFALPEAVESMRKTRRAEVTKEFVSVSGADPLNLVGVILPGAKVPALAGNRVLYLDGIAVAALIGGAVQWLETIDAAQMRIAEDLLIQRRAGAPMLAYLR